MLSYVVAGLAFSAPPSLTRRDLFANAAAVATVAMPSVAFAKPEDYAGAADRKKAAKEAERIAALGPDYKSPYQKIMIAATAREAEEKAALQAAMKGPSSANGKDENGVSFRKPYDPNACSVECREKRLKKYGY